MTHVPVLLNEVIESLNIKPDGVYVDLTLGGGGHSYEVLKRLNHQGFLIAFDQDLEAIKYAKEKLKEFNNKIIIHANFKEAKKHLIELGYDQVDGIFMDLGMSSFQIDDSERGFSYMEDGPLDMRMNQNNPLTAEEILNTYSLSDLNNIFKDYGEEPKSYLIAKKIIQNRPLKTTFDLVNITDQYKTGKGHSAKRVFQALRIYLNNEMHVLETVLPEALSLLKKDGVISVLTFHSLEDRIVKHFIKENVEEPYIKGLPTLPKEMPLRYYNKKPILPSELEIRSNPRAKSAKLRAAIKN
jgi:16S rRNA (cytosine1402-N4)-methyltransferase